MANFSDPSSRKSAREALKSWSNLQALGKHTLARLKIVQVWQEQMGYDATPASSGIALRHVLQDAIEALRPNDGRPDFSQKRWRPYIILNQQYVNGRKPDYIAGRLNIARSTYYQEQARAIDRLVDILYHREQTGEITPLSKKQPAIPFLPPPRPPHALIGRDDLLHQIKQKVMQPGALSALSGLPGAGKTALAIELAHDPEVITHFQDGILWAGLGPHPDVLSLLGTWETAVGISPQKAGAPGGIAAKAQAIHAAIGMRRMLLIIDDAWQIETALAFKVGGPNCAHLITTRIPEIAPAFAGETTVTVRELDEAHSIALLARLVPEVVQTRPQEIKALVKTVGGLPLALALMGSYLQKESRTGQQRRLQAALNCLKHAETRFQLSQPQSPLTSNPGLPSGSPLSLTAVIEMSVAALDAPARCALWSLSVFPPKPNTFSEKAATAVCAAPLTALDALVDAGLLESDTARRYALHQTIADYARLQGDRQTIAQASRRLVTHFTHFVQTHKKAYNRLQREINNILTTFEVALKKQWNSALVQGANAFYPFLESRGLYDLANCYLHHAAQAARSLQDTAAQAATHYHLGRTAENQGDYEQAEQHYRHGLMLARMCEDSEKMSALLQGVGTMATRRGEYEQAETYYHEGLALASQNNDKERKGMLLRNLGVMAAKHGEYEEARSYFQEGLSLAYEIGRREQISDLLLHLGALAEGQGNYLQAGTCYREGLALARTVGHREKEASLLRSLGVLAAKQGNEQQAEAYFQEGLALAREMGHPEQIGASLTNLGKLAAQVGDYVQAKAYSQEGLALARSINHHEMSSVLLMNLGQLAGGQGEYVQAEAYLQEGLALARKIDHRQRVGELLAYLGELAADRKQYRRAQAYLQEGLALAREMGYRELTGFLLKDLGRVAIECEDDRQALDYLQEGLALAREIGHALCMSATLNEQGRLYLQRQNVEAARVAFDEALLMAQKAELKETAATALYGLARVAAAQDDVAEAYRCGQEARALFLKIGHHKTAEITRWLSNL